MSLVEIKKRTVISRIRGQISERKVEQFFAPVNLLNVSINTRRIHQLATNQEWGFHNARVNSVAWSPDSLLVASGSLDTSIIIWSVEKPAKHIIIKSKLVLNVT
jgi:WD40 repeat protein